MITFAALLITLLQASVVGYPGLDAPTTPCHLLAGGEGALYFYPRQPSSPTDRDNIPFGHPTAALEVDTTHNPLRVMTHKPLYHDNSLCYTAEHHTTLTYIALTLHLRCVYIALTLH